MYFLFADKIGQHAKSYYNNDSKLRNNIFRASLQYNKVHGKENYYH